MAMYPVSVSIKFQMCGTRGFCLIPKKPPRSLFKNSDIALFTNISTSSGGILMKFGM